MLNKYIPPDFDPAKIPRGKAPKGGQIKVRIMLPMTICCNTCGEFICKGTKFNARKEDVKGENYLGIQIFRFYFRCTRCSAELAMKTDPKNGDYVVEAGASRNYEAWRDTTEEDEAKARADDEENNEMRRLENRTEESKREMDIMAALDEMRSLNARHAGISNADALNAMTANTRTDKERYASAPCCRCLRRDCDANFRPGRLTFVSPSLSRRADELDAETARAIFKEQRAKIVKRIESESDDDDHVAAKKARVDAPAVSVVVKRPTNSAVKAKVKSNAAAAPPKAESPPPAGLGGLLGDYGSDSD